MWYAKYVVLKMLLDQCLYRVSAGISTATTVGPRVACQQTYGRLTLSGVWWPTDGITASATVECHVNGTIANSTVGLGWPGNCPEAATATVELQEALRRYYCSIHYLTSVGIPTVLWRLPSEVRAIISGQISCRSLSRPNSGSPKVCYIFHA